MQIPFSEAGLLGVFGQYNLALGPIALALWLASAAVAVDWLGRRRLSDRWVAAFLALHWAWGSATRRCPPSGCRARPRC